MLGIDTQFGSIEILTICVQDLDMTFLGVKLIGNFFWAKNYKGTQRENLYAFVCVSSGRSSRPAAGTTSGSQSTILS